MNQLVKHLLLNNFDEILSKSLLNCHCRGLHSIMLLESPEKTIRLYISMPGSDMYKNTYENMLHGLSLGFHPHHCNLTLHCIKGSFVNWEVEECTTLGTPLTKYRYHSKIKEGEISFEDLGQSKLLTTCYRHLKEGDSVHMKANEIHTVACELGSLSAWLVYEGKKDEDYEAFCWSNSNPNEQEFSGLYIKPTKSEIIELLKLVDLL